MKMQEPKRLDTSAELVAQRIETLIMDGVLKPGQVLPSERQLTQRLTVSRSALREGLQILRVRGLIETQHGKGSFVANLIDSAASKPLEHLLQAQGRTLYDLLEVRELLESEAAQLAASRGTEADHIMIRRRFQELEDLQAQEGAPEQIARADHAFHQAICEASHNPVLVHMISLFNDLMLSTVRVSVQHLYPDQDSKRKLDRQHARLCHAVTQGQADLARRAAREHIDGIRRQLQELEARQLRLEHARQRLNGL
ncbi:transcriptional regulator [Alcaligenes pakistanensis]|uniref:Transcriptional regulator n=1 Tax=Alcaligenes pakistanensis TaxID=1482717 RepID=A0A8H9IQ06_9BURK|nr:transcriptional regulator GlcC [Alcaligenes pakistanensis]GHC55562.1 transcriptional regulator [Alcaligenes pakistanensis]HCA16744.1 transcriptional regulator GlcC [Alcaligenes faecalis]